MDESVTKFTPSTVASRRKALEHVRGSSALEGIGEAPFKRSLMEKYISGQKTIEQLIQEVGEHHGLVDVHKPNGN